MSEHEEQCEVVKWCRSAGLFVYAVPNAAERGYKASAWLRAEGLTAGVPDLCLPYPRGKYGALYVEMKYGKNTLTESQSKVIPMLEAAGNKCVVCYSAKEAIKEIQDYLCQKI